jgi:hypothetical protein
MDSARRPRRLDPRETPYKPHEPVQPNGEPRPSSPSRIDERCPVRYYPLFPLASRRKPPIRYY